MTGHLTATDTVSMLGSNGERNTATVRLRYLDGYTQLGYRTYSTTSGPFLGVLGCNIHKKMFFENDSKEITHNPVEKPLSTYCVFPTLFF